MRKILLIGIVQSVCQSMIGGPFEATEIRERRATFDTIEDLKEYVQSARLAKPRKASFSGTINFRDDSVLNGCFCYDYEDDVVLLHNPKKFT